MPRVESATRQAQTIYEGPKADDEFTRMQFYLFTLVHYATEGFDYINRLCDAVPWPFVVGVVLLFAALCTAQPPQATGAALVAAVLWWFLVMTEGAPHAARHRRYHTHRRDSATARIKVVLTHPAQTVKEAHMPEVIHKPQPKPTVLLTVRVEAPIKDEYAKARKVADRQNIDLTSMISTALNDVFKAVTNAAPTKVTALNER
jgi:hypothetical protein